MYQRRTYLSRLKNHDRIARKRKRRYPAVDSWPHIPRFLTLSLSYLHINILLILSHASSSYTTRSVNNLNTKLADRKELFAGKWLPIHSKSVVMKISLLAKLSSKVTVLSMNFHCFGVNLSTLRKGVNFSLDQPKWFKL